LTQTPPLVSALIDTQALQVAPGDEVFWYTSGTVGPYYINTHYLYGGQQPAQELLEFIDETKDDPHKLPQALYNRVTKMYDADPSYRVVIDALAGQIAEQIDGGDGASAKFDWVSGGERRDWFFSVAVAARLDRPHLYLFKDLRLALWDRARSKEGAEPIEDLKGSSTLHVADLVTEASSYSRMWVPALRQRNGDMARALNVVDRAQGGIEVIEALGVSASALLRVDEGLFKILFDGGLIDSEQHQRLVAYFRDPHGAMRQFLIDHPEFVEGALRGSDPRAAERARLLVEGDLYDMGK
jgi:orotate phosphoribosyltransferase